MKLKPCHLCGALIVLVACLPARGEVSLHLPLGPWYRPGKYIPVQLRAAHDAEEFFVAVGASNVNREEDISRGSGRTSIRVKSGSLDAVVPWLVMDGRARHPRASLEVRGQFNQTADGPELKLLGASDKLVGMTGEHGTFARRLLPEGNLIRVALDPAQPIRGNAAAWELLDAVLLDGESFARLQPGQLAGLIASGVIVAVKSGSAPDGAWPWRQEEDWWVLSFTPAGPRSSGYPEAAYKPIADWQPGWPWSFRRRMLFLAVALCVPFLALALWKPRLASVWALLLGIGITIGFREWWSLQLAYQQAGGEVIIKGSALTQTDGWSYITATQARFPSLRWSDVMRPIFASESGHDDIWMALNCDTSGRPLDFYIRLPARRKVAFMTRSVGMRAPQSKTDPQVTTPLREMAGELYLSSEVGVEGQLAGMPTATTPAYGYVEILQWNALVLRRK